ncbi:hypothetical protein GGR57DRAFT_425131 [Xylariaceae sp. FL1272]|nr:hypothetical protein GGR57DRAFT_425131 [Xylariaceae sp. FL1272]
MRRAPLFPLFLFSIISKNLIPSLHRYPSCITLLPSTIFQHLSNQIGPCNNSYWPKHQNSASSAVFLIAFRTWQSCHLTGDNRLRGNLGGAKP